MVDIVIASRNIGKIKEVNDIYKNYKINLLTLEDVNFDKTIIEDRNTFLDNALIKAETVSSFTKKNVLADDSGLEVEYLEGRPGVHSSRFAGDISDDNRNNIKLLKMLEEVPFEKRNAQFKCVMVLMIRDKEPIVTEGILKGRISDSLRGDNGFGYDPIFIPEGYNKTLAELKIEEKNKISHRYQALKKMSFFIKNL